MSDVSRDSVIGLNGDEDWPKVKIHQGDNVRICAAALPKAARGPTVSEMKKRKERSFLGGLLK